MTPEKPHDDEPDTSALSASRQLNVIQREANEQLVGFAIRAQERSEEAEGAKARAELSERDLRALADFREMFIGIVGHDLRNPLMSIAMAAEALVARDRLDDRDRMNVTRIIRSCDRMTRMVTQLLDLTRARLGGGLPLTFVTADLAEIARHVIDEFAGQTVDLEIDGEVTGTWDPDRLAEVLSNLTGNALDHAADGTTVRVAITGTGAEVVVAISNQGDAIPADLLPILFEAFRRGRVRTSTKSSNLGLGLYISSEIMRGHGGSLAASSSDGTTTFVARLPRERPRAGSPDSTAPSPSA